MEDIVLTWSYLINGREIEIRKKIKHKALIS